MPDIVTIQDAMSRVMSDVREVAKNDRNTQQNFSFRGVDAVVNAVAPALRKHGVVVVPTVEEKEYVPFTTSKGTNMMCCRVTVRFTFIGPGKDSVDAVVPGEAMDAGDKSTAKAMSVAFRIALLQALALPTDDQDPDATSYQDVAPSAAPGESTAKPPTGPSDVTSSSAGDGAQAAQDAASPSLSVLPGGSTDPAAPEEPTTGGEATVTPGASGAATTYLSAEEKRELIRDYHSSKLVVAAFAARFGERINSMNDITCEMLEEMNGG